MTSFVRPDGLRDARLAGLPTSCSLVVSSSLGSHGAKEDFVSVTGLPADSVGVISPPSADAPGKPDRSLTDDPPRCDRRGRGDHSTGPQAARVTEPNLLFNLLYWATHIPAALLAMVLLIATGFGLFALAVIAVSGGTP